DTISLCTTAAGFSSFTSSSSFGLFVDWPEGIWHFGDSLFGDVLSLLVDWGLVGDLLLLLFLLLALAFGLSALLLLFCSGTFGKTVAGFTFGLARSGLALLTDAALLLLVVVGTGAAAAAAGDW